MKKGLLLFFLLSLVVLSVGCAVTTSMDVVETEEDVTWVVVQSPITGRYYEVITKLVGYTGFMAMSEVSQQEYESYLLNKGGKE